MGDDWDDILPARGKEYLGYPTQKPLELLKRIIKISTDPKDFVLDPFCGCATACSAAESLQRRWIGIDISEKAVELFRERLENDWPLPKFFPDQVKVIHRTDIPILKPKRSKDIKEILYGRQGGHCKGCGVHFEIKNLTLDHITPTSKGGQDADENLQLLCGHCNSKKHDRTMAEFMADMKKRTID